MTNTPASVAVVQADRNMADAMIEELMLIPGNRDYIATTYARHRLAFQQPGGEARERSDDEAMNLIHRAAKLIEPGEGEAVFYLRVGGEHSQLTTKAKNIEPNRALRLAMNALSAEARDAKNCPYHAKPAPDTALREAQWTPHIGEEVRAAPHIVEKWPEWRDVRLWVVGLSVERNGLRNPVEGINVAVSEEWPVTRKTPGFTDEFFIHREADDLVPIAATPSQKQGEGL